VPLPDPRTPQGRRVLAAGLALLAAVVAISWYGWSTTSAQVRVQVTAYEVESDALTRVEFDVSRPAGTALTCRVSALDDRKGRVGTVIETVPATGPTVVHEVVRVRTSARAVTGVVESCVRGADAG
jgi:hypothetical protein